MEQIKISFAKSLFVLIRYLNSLTISGTIIMGADQMEALEPEKESRNRLIDILDESNEGPQLSSKKTGSSGRAFEVAP